MGQVRKIKAGLVVNSSASDFVGEIGNIFFDISDGVLRLSDGSTPGGVPLTSGGTEGGASTFRQLLDTPSSFTGSGGYFVKVNAQASALEFVNVSLFDGNYNSLTNKPTLFNPADITQTLTPRTDIAIDLGTATKRWRDLYLSGNTIYLGDTTISRNASGGVDLPANSKINGKKIAEDIKDLTDSDGLLTSGGVTSYNDLTNKPDLSVYQLSATAFSGSYTDLTNKPTIPTDISDLTDLNNVLASSGAGYSLPIATNSSLGGIKIGSGLTINGSGVVSVTAVGVTSYNDLTDTPDLTVYQLAATAFSGNYSDLVGAPTIPTVPTNISAFTNDAGYLTSVGTISYNDLSNLPTLFSGSYNDLTDTPTIPTVPTALSAFTNDTGYITGYTVTQTDVTQYQAALSITESQISDLKAYLTTVAFADLTTTPTTLSGYGITDAYTSTQVDSAISTAINNVIGGAPALLDTLNELAAAIGDDENFVTSINNTLALKVNNADLATVAISGSYIDLTNKPTIPTDISQLTDTTNRLASNITLDDVFMYSLIF